MPDAPSPSLDAIRTELEQVLREYDDAPASDKERIEIKIKVLENCERLLIDFYGDFHQGRRAPRR
jgi:hypothetical protein